MFYEGAPRLIEAGVMVPGLQIGDPRRIVVEAYPGVLARALIGKKSYKNDAKRKQTSALHNARQEILDKIENGALKKHYGLEVSAPLSLADDPAGDSLDALLCAIQAAFAWNRRGDRFGEPANSDPLEGWIADPMPEI